MFLVFLCQGYSFQKPVIFSLNFIEILKVFDFNLEYLKKFLSSSVSEAVSGIEICCEAVIPLLSMVRSAIHPSVRFNTCVA